MSTGFDFRCNEGECGVTEKQVSVFKETGCLIQRGLFGQKEIQKIEQMLQESDLIKKYSYGIPDHTGRMPRMMLWLHPGSDVTGMMARCKKVVDTAEKLLGGEVYHYHTKLIMKDPLVGGGFEWHQDYGYWYFNGLLYPDAVSVMVSLDKCTKENGCVQVLPGSHHVGRIDHVPVAGQTAADPDRVEHLRKKFPLQYIELEPGDAFFMHSNVLHKSDHNNSPSRRWLFIMAYNKATNNPLENLTGPFPRYTPLSKVPNSALLDCQNLSDFSGKDFLDPTKDKNVKADRNN
ncbi:L-proline trans-4-hydroxylase-like [Saccostrea cucullata]|uniref:L-proline trans-4-hydroxylase-like n=1 Tax=Saccostrea cuccullata TaxID=36930 RepID=UPI002ED4272E